MRKVYLFMMVTVDGFFEGLNHDINWHNTDKEFDKFAVDQLDQTGAILFGKTTYEMMYSFWPTDMAMSEAPQVTKAMNALPKYVFSHSLKSADWNNTTLSADINEVVNLKKQDGKDIAVFGSNNLCVSLMEKDLVDEYRIMISPVILKEGTLLFSGIKQSAKLKLIATREFKSNGNVLNTYTNF